MSKKARRHGGTEARRGAWGDLVVSGRHAFVAVCLMIVLAGAAAGQTEDSRSTDATPAGLAFRVAKLVAMDDADTVINDAVVLVKGSEIEALGPADQVKVPEGYRVLDFPEHWLVPGIVEAHDHSAAGWWNDLNDMVYQTNPGLDTRCIPPPDNDWIKAARTGGVTTVLLLPGSGTNLAGWVPVSTNTTPTNVLFYTDPKTSNYLRRFYWAFQFP